MFNFYGFTNSLSFILMAWNYSAKMGTLTAIVSAINIIVIHWMVLGEERFLDKKYGIVYHEYMNKTPRYIGLSGR